MKRYEKGKEVLVSVKTPDKYLNATLGTPAGKTVVALCGDRVVNIPVQPDVKFRCKVVDADCYLPDDYKIVCKGESIGLLVGTKLVFDSRERVTTKGVKEVVLWKRNGENDFVIMYVGVTVAGLEE